MTTPTLFPTEQSVTASPGPRLELAGWTWVFRLPRELAGLNRTMWRHWTVQRAEREAWEQEFRNAIASFACVRSAEGWPNGDEALAFRKLLTQRERRRIRVLRVVPHRRHLLCDLGNIRACDKHLVDAMKNVGLITDDRKAWLEHEEPREFIGEGFLTVVQLDRPDVRGLWR